MDIMSVYVYVCACTARESVPVGRVISGIEKGVQGLESNDRCASIAKKGYKIDPLGHWGSKFSRS